MKYAVEEEERPSRRGLGRKVADEPEDTEITLGPRSLLGIFFGLILICGIFFGLGYSVGRVSNGSAEPETTSPTLAQGSDSVAKPSPQQSVGVPATDAAASTTATPASAPDTPGATTAGSVTVSAATGAASATAAPAATPASSTPAPAAFRSETAGGPVAAAEAMRRAALVQPAKSGTMVQVAAVSVPQDAEILVAALRRHGFTPVIRHTSDDQLLHVQIGPFATRAQANAMRSQLLADGYNALLK